MPRIDDSGSNNSPIPEEAKNNAKTPSFFGPNGASRLKSGINKKRNNKTGKVVKPYYILVITNVKTVKKKDWK